MYIKRKKAMAKKQFRGVISFDFNVEQENYKMFGELENQLKLHMDLFVARLASGEMDDEFNLSKYVSVENPQSLFRDRRGPTGPIEQIAFRGGRGLNTKLTPAQISRLSEMGKKLQQGQSLTPEEMSRYSDHLKRAKQQGVAGNWPDAPTGE